MDSCVPGISSVVVVGVPHLMEHLLDGLRSGLVGGRHRKRVGAETTRTELGANQP
jgi:hypothetical protein